MQENSKAMQVYPFKLQTVSSVILSPRDQSLYVTGVDFEKQENTQMMKFIYPFYQYGMYEEHDPAQTQYYIPGSSIKGAILSGGQKSGAVNLAVDDVKISHADLQLKNLQKLQYAQKLEKLGEKAISTQQNQRKMIKLEPFFPAIAVQMLTQGVTCTGEMFCGSDPKELLAKAQGETLKKLKAYNEHLKQIIGECKVNPLQSSLKDAEQECIELLEQVGANVDQIIEEIEGVGSGGQDGFYLILGGYKGLILAGVIGNEGDRGAVFIDKDTKLPHGLVKILRN